MTDVKLMLKWRRKLTAIYWMLYFIGSNFLDKDCDKALEVTLLCRDSGSWNKSTFNYTTGRFAGLEILGDVLNGECVLTWTNFIHHRLLFVEVLKLDLLAVFQFIFRQVFKITKHFTKSKCFNRTLVLIKL